MRILSELHDIIKNHPYRLTKDDKYRESYQKLLYKLGDLFYNLIKEDKKYSESKRMLHDFSGSIRKIDSKEWDHFTHTERCIGVIHTYIDTEEVPYFYEYYTGVNIPDTLHRSIKCIFDERDGNYYPDFTLEELTKTIANFKLGKYNQNQLDWYITLKDRLEKNSEQRK